MRKKVKGYELHGPFRLRTGLGLGFRVDSFELRVWFGV